MDRAAPRSHARVYRHRWPRRLPRDGRDDESCAVAALSLGDDRLVPGQLDFAILRSRSAATLDVHSRTPRAAASLGPRLARNLARHSVWSRDVSPILVGGTLAVDSVRRPRQRDIA